MAELDAASSRLAAHIGAVPDLEPLPSIVRNKEHRHSTAVRSLKAMGEGGWRTQADLFELGLVSCDVCQACFEAKGTFLHRCVSCSVRSETRKAYGEGSDDAQAVISKAQSSERAEDPLFKHGVLAARPRTRKPKLELRFAWNYDGGFFTGYVSTDGSLRRHGRRDDNR